MTQDYITAILEETIPKEAFHSISFSQDLKLRTLPGKSLTIEDPDSIAGVLRTGKTYKFIVMVSGVERVRAFTQSVTQTGKFSGTIRHLKWQPTPDDYLCMDENLIEEPMSVIGTVNGHVLLPRMLLGGVAVGNAITWGLDQFRLVAVYNA